MWRFLGETSVLQELGLFPTCMHGLVWLKLGGKALDSLLSSLQLRLVVSAWSPGAPECAAALTQSQLQASSHLAQK